MKVVISNNSKLSSSPSRITVNNVNNIGRAVFGKTAKSRITLSNVNNIGRAVFGKITKAGQISLQELGDVVTTGQQDGDVLVYQANTSTYNIKTLPKVDGGAF